MKKLVSLVATMAMASVIFTGCGSKAASFDVKSLGSDLRTQITYDDELTELDLDMAGMFLNLSGIDIVNASIYESSGATAEEIVILECSSADEAKKADAMMKERVAEQKESFVDYVPEEIPKLDAAIIKVNGNYAVLSVSGDAKAASGIIDKYL